MDSLVAEVARQIPALACLAWVVVKFLAHIDADAARRATLDKETRDHVRGLGEACHQVQSETAHKLATALERNSDALSKSAIIADQVQEVLQDAVDEIRLCREGRSA